MNSLAATSLLLIGLVSGCAKPAYVLDPTHEETARAKLDAQWFTRDIYDGNGLAAVELTYCPLQPNVATVCRTGIVWRRDDSFFMDLEPAAAAPQPAAALPAPFATNR
jgi:hypothetical protein